MKDINILRISWFLIGASFVGIQLSLSKEEYNITFLLIILCILMGWLGEKKYSK